MLGRMLALGGDGGRVMLVDEENGKERWAVQAHSGWITHVAMSPDGRFVASVDHFDEFWKLWDAATGAEWMTGRWHDGTGKCRCSYSEKFRSFNKRCPVQAHKSGLTAVAFSPSLPAGGALKDELAPRPTPPPPVRPIRAATSFLTNFLFPYPLASDHRRTNRHLPPPSGCAIIFATGSSDRSVILWDAHTGKAHHVMQEAHDGWISSLSFSLDGSRLASGSEDGSIHVWDAKMGASLRTMRNIAPTAYSPIPPVKWVQFSPTEDRILVSAGYPPEKIQFYDADSGEKFREINGYEFAVFSPDGRTIATDRGGGFVNLVDLETEAVRLWMGGHTPPPQTHEWGTSGVCSAVWSSDGRTLSSCNFAGICRVWDLTSPSLLYEINVTTQKVGALSVAWARDCVRDEKCVAFAMGHTPRLGAGSRVLALEVGVIRMILDRV